MQHALLFSSSIVAGLVNAVAGGGTFFTFPSLIAAGVPSLVANATSTVAASPGNILASWVYRHELKRYRSRLLSMGATVALGALAGTILLTLTGESSFTRLVPWLILFATLIFAAAPLLRKWLGNREARPRGSMGFVGYLTFFIGSIYGGYFGAGLGIMLMSLMGLNGIHDVQEANALKNFLNGVSTVVSILSLSAQGLINWRIGAMMAVGAVIGGLVGGRVARKLNPAALRGLVILVGFSLTVYYFAK